MIRVIASDMDGTLLGDDHRIAPETLEAIKEAQEAGIRFMIATGRNFKGAMAELQDTGLVCDYVVGSGAEVRDPMQNVIETRVLSRELCRRVYKSVKKFPVSVIFCTDGYDYRVGTPEEVEESLILELQLFHENMTREEILKTSVYRRIKENSKVVSGLKEMEEKKIPVYKIFLFSDDTDMLEQIDKVLGENRDIAVASSFPTNLEITDVRAQKGPVLKNYIERLGYAMDEVMVFGDSLNDLSMLEMDFGATVAMENASPEVKAAAKYVTKSNNEHGVAYAIRELLKRQNV
ncbi:MAG TPA: Cof-type HAD-IIB family hydrolase [Candidatus Mediterraneibacter pullicola]|uniref:Cof-type HAD-IIB family hydrolase n=1 Tax=Candidatus Mediterraneibacter pullicola TaxID=2838682 RepID=A0A9D2H8F3_9FIRM|nr:Cof-type HAD-IIB family hydrolase [Candidatus Mediterraneibacter pullicola]